MESNGAQADLILCRCGHSLNSHYFGNGLPSGCNVRKGWGVRGTAWADGCKEYQPDNLLTIEQLAKKKGFI